MNTTELRRRRFFDALARVLVFALFIVLFVAAVVLAPAALLTGCAAPGEPPPGAIDFVTNAAQRAVVVLREAREGASTSAGGCEKNGEGAQASSDSPSIPPSPALLFRFGGVKATPAEDGRCHLSRLAIGADSLSFHWDTGIPSDWKRGDTKKGPMILACAFYFDDASERWIGGKFDWIDEARSSRPLENIRAGYGGWDAAAWAAARRRAFCVMSADGKKRSNLLED